MSLLAFVDPVAPVRLITGQEGSPLAPASFHLSAMEWLSLGVVGLIVGAVAFWLWRRWRLGTRVDLDRVAAAALARRLGLSRRERAALWDLARNDNEHSPLDLLVSVKKLSAAATRRAQNVTDDSAREALSDLCRTLDAQPPVFAPSTSEKTQSGPRTRVGAAKTPLRGPSRPSVVTPRLIDRRG